MTRQRSPGCCRARAAGLEPRSHTTRQVSDAWSSASGETADAWQNVRSIIQHTAPAKRSEIAGRRTGLLAE
ncbi:hypothetical protein ACGFMK_19710 [Amycolatopsis sp. NPDC049252]|uniref:hypothetical protein n=1 Tax=Amycolatopsis sp. NPDC049252 TaxID=3363933 RepID=UPI003718BFD0